MNSRVLSGEGPETTGETPIQGHVQEHIFLHFSVAYCSCVPMLISRMIEIDLQFSGREKKKHIFLLLYLFIQTVKIVLFVDDAEMEKKIQLVLSEE